MHLKIIARQFRFQVTAAIKLHCQTCHFKYIQSSSDDSALTPTPDASTVHWHRVHTWYRFADPMHLENPKKWLIQKPGCLQ